MAVGGYCIAVAAADEWLRNNMHTVHRDYCNCNRDGDLLRWSLSLSLERVLWGWCRIELIEYILFVQGLIFKHYAATIDRFFFSLSMILIPE